MVLDLAKSYYGYDTENTTKKLDKFHPKLNFCTYKSTYQQSVKENGENYIGKSHI